ncbi:glutamine--fructose-6-phosphate transaminase (isomerizing) [Bacteroides caecigallinarum]|uniref:glutamine--fructose-6-phosphate transaminase (isomerizing) n=1 Tax=Bacteroides caecigallinarum TaxID=1411144 RepID=UPI001F1DD2F8|nr:glutamine--fructose-6-phosphate transaminase (isomerizing) [Bacteroides caecigallinarum]MCF2581511.1 glutamine--fructose-6-phosphate transaminase (isomerizing) [Bacteroides caecigallinarum]
MCGIVGYIGRKQAYPILIEGLKRLEYRGYDSAGVALMPAKNIINVYKSAGKVKQLEAAVAGCDVAGCAGIAHTRWATHGEPNKENSHPHCSMGGRLALVHNGIIENYAVLKEKLTAEGYAFASDTDTEVLVQLIDYIQKKGNYNLVTAVQLALKEVVGAYAIAVMDRENPEMIVAARKSSPLVIGLADDGLYLASDATPIIEHTNRMVYPDDEEVAALYKDGSYRIMNLENVECCHEAQTVALNIGQLQKGGFPHFMIKEIYDQPECLADCMRGRVMADMNRIVISAVNNYKDVLMRAKRFIIVACGTSWHAGLIGKQLIESFCRIPVEVEYASEFRYRNPVVGKDDVVIAISQSGETADTLAAIELARERGAFIYGICNVVGSSIARATDTGSYIHVGPEIGVASTKAFTGQVTVLAMFALALAQVQGKISGEQMKETIEELVSVPDKIREVLKQDDYINNMAKVFTYAHNFIYLGRGYAFPVALEGALKLKEISYIHAEGYPAAEMKHGPIALIDMNMPVVVIATKSPLYEKVVSNIQEIKARGGKILAVITEGDTVIKEMADYSIEVPETMECLESLVTSVPLQLLAYHIAANKGLDVDKPRNLAKSVTVE